MSITVSETSKYYGEQKAVNNISFSLEKGEIVGFLGPNGAGKSTTMKMITGALSADAGNITVCGLPVKNGNTAVKQKIGYLPEANPLYHDMYTREYLGFIAGIHQVKQPAEKVEEVINMVGLGPESHKTIGQLSKGYKQRVGLAAALVHDPEVLILDEPTSGLDPNQIIEIRELIKRLGQNKTVLFSSHIMQEVEAVCDRVIIINKGNIVADDSLQNLQKNSSNQQLVKIEFYENVEPRILEKFNGVIKVEQLKPKTFSIHCEDAEKLKRALLQFSMDKNIDIISLHSESRNLESIFKSLTN